MNLDPKIEKIIEKFGEGEFGIITNRKEAIKKILNEFNEKEFEIYIWDAVNEHEKKIHKPGGLKKEEIDNIKTDPALHHDENVGKAFLLSRNDQYLEGKTLRPMEKEKLRKKIHAAKRKEIMKEWEIYKKHFEELVFHGEKFLAAENIDDFFREGTETYKIIESAENKFHSDMGILIGSLNSLHQYYRFASLFRYRPSSLEILLGSGDMSV